MSGRFCLIGKSLPHTLSPEIHSAFGRADYGVEELENEDALARFVRSGKYDGFNVTIPYKRAIMPLLDGLDDVAREAGAVNTVARIDGKYIGYNTDVGGMEYALRRAGISLAGKKTLILGSGGASHTAAYIAREQGASGVSIASRSGGINYQNCYDLQDTQVIINATPVGMTPNAYQTPLNVSKFARLEGVFDAVYNPLETLLVCQARAIGVRATNGLDMLVEQARLAHNIFCKVTGEAEKAEQESEKVCDMLKERMRNIVLIGMAGVGKTSTGRALAKMLGRKFADTDELVEREIGEDIPTIFAKEGEAKFREYEARAVRECCSRLGLVIAVGGGAILSEENRFFMQANGVIVYLTRDISLADRRDRPLSANENAVKRLFEQRRPIYEQMADITVSNDGSVDDAANKISEELAKL